MKIAVLLSSYNGECYIKEQIDSILAQCGDFTMDLFVRDDNSSDATQKILQKYAEIGRLQWYAGANLGPARSFRELLTRCRGYDFYAFADQDDFWQPLKLQRGIEKIEWEKEAALYIGNAELVDSNLKTLGRNVYKQAPKTDFYTLSCAGGLLGCTMVFNNKLADLFRRTSDTCQMVMHDFYLALLCSSVNGSLFFDEKPYMKYRQHENNVVGVAFGRLKTVKTRLHDIKIKPSVSIAEQAQSLLDISEITGYKRTWLEFLSNYRKNIYYRIRLACTTKTHYINVNRALTMRTAILLGNR